MMGLKLTRECTYGYVSILIARSPDLIALSNAVEVGEPADIQTAIFRGLLGPEYSALAQAKAVDEAEDRVYNIYKELVSGLAGLAPVPYNRYVDRFAEAFDIDKAVSLALSVERRTVMPKRMLSRVEALLDHVLYSKAVEGEASAYRGCLGLGSSVNALKTAECFVRVYVDRVSNALKEVDKVEPVDASLRVFYEFALLRLYRYLASSRALRVAEGVGAEAIAKGVGIPAQYAPKALEVVRKLNECLEKGFSLYTVCELRSLYSDLRHLLFTPYSLVDRLTYLLIHKFYESMLVRHLAMHRYAWR